MIIYLYVKLVLSLLNLYKREIKLSMFIKNTTQLLSSKLDGTQLNLRKIGLMALEKARNAVKPKKIIEKSINLHL